MNAQMIREIELRHADFRSQEHGAEAAALKDCADLLRELTAQMAEKNAALRESIELQKSADAHSREVFVWQREQFSRPDLGTFLTELKKEFWVQFEGEPWSYEQIMTKLELAIGQTALKLEAK